MRRQLERNFREKFETLNRVRLTDAEFSRLMDEIVTPDVFAAARACASETVLSAMTARPYGHHAEASRHVMLTMRSVDENGFGQKVRDWNRTETVERWRERWADHVNERLAELDIDARIDHRSLEAQGIGLEPQTKIGAPAQRMEAAGLEADRAEDHRRIARENGACIVADPSSALDAITRQQSTFTRRDMAMFAHRHSDGIDQFNEVMGAMRGAPDLVELGKDDFGQDRFRRLTLQASKSTLKSALQ